MHEVRGIVAITVVARGFAPCVHHLRNKMDRRAAMAADMFCRSQIVPLRRAAATQ